MSEKRNLPTARYVQCGFHKLADDPCKDRFGTHFASCPIKRTMISSSAPSTARVWPSRVPSPHPTRPSSSVIFTKSQRGFTLKYSMSLIGAMSIAMVLITELALVTRSDVVPLATYSYMSCNQLHSDAEIGRLGTHCNDVSGCFAGAPQISVGVPKLIWGSNITI
jgi:hypothetical protein